MLTVSKPGYGERSFANELAPRICLEVCGGGYTTRQTMRAMDVYSSLRTKGVARVGKVTLRLEGELPEFQVNS